MTTPYVDDVQALRRVFSGFPSGVAALAAVVDGDPTVLVVSSFSVGVSQDPPLVLCAVQRSSTTWPLLAKAPAIGVSVLGEDHTGNARRLASRDKDTRFEGIDTLVSDSGSVFLHGAPIWLDCSIEGVHDAGDHEIVVLRVLGFRDFPHRPLIWHRSAFTTLHSAAQEEVNGLDRVKGER
ncbi:flavin reductase family protein [Saccharothrix deserti]|uniref:flavin reductase family protein n=1 Tax=Saccharothrix deserti TaxID=2593674 RepID=UPI00131E6CF5|nr:flavin reductase family protein [Saccharothrix deserti]